MFAGAWKLLRDSVEGFIEDEALSRGAAMAFYAATSLGPILLIVIAIAGIVFGDQAAENAIAEQLNGLMGHKSAELLQSAIRSASHESSGKLASLIGVVALVVTASGVFGEMQATLNAIWRAQPTGTTVARLIRARAISLGLVAALGFLLMVSLVASAGISALGTIINRYFPFGHIIFTALNELISFLLIWVMFAAIYKVLPDRYLEWSDVWVGAAVTAALFTVGKYLIGLYIGSSSIASSYGAAGALIVLLLWFYYSSEIFLLGAEFTRAYSIHHGSRSDAPHAAAILKTPSPRAMLLTSETPEKMVAEGRIAASSCWPDIALVLTALVVIRELRGQRRRRRKATAKPIRVG